MRRLMLLSLFLILCPTFSWALATTMEIGVRGGMDAKLVEENYSFAEVYYHKRLPWKKQLAPGVVVYVRLDAGACYYDAASDDSGWLALGGDLVMSLMNGAWELEAGWRPTILFDHELGQDDLGGPIQFSSHLGTSVYLGDAALSYRYQHISNAKLYDQNPGLDVHMFGVGVRY